MKTLYSKQIMVIILVCFCFLPLIHSQQTLVLQPDEEFGKDAYLRSLSPSTNYGNHPDFSAHAWTNQGMPVTVRSIIHFDLTLIPKEAAINEAILYLYSYDSPHNGTHWPRSGPNEAILCRVLSTWDENTVNWSNQPTTTEQNQVFLPTSTYPIQDYLVDVTRMVQDMVDHPEENHGFLFRQVTEDYYRRMLFASSDHPNPSLRPKLVITYLDPSNPSAEENECLFSLFPNPARNTVEIELLSHPVEPPDLDVFSVSGQHVEHFSGIQQKNSLDVSNFSEAIYLIRISSKNCSSIKKIVVQK